MSLRSCSRDSANGRGSSAPAGAGTARDERGSQHRGRLAKNPLLFLCLIFAQTCRRKLDYQAAGVASACGCGAVPSTCSWRYLDHSRSSAFVFDGRAMPNLRTARIIARTLTHGSAIELRIWARKDRRTDVSFGPDLVQHGIQRMA